MVTILGILTIFLVVKGRLHFNFKTLVYLITGAIVSEGFSYEVKFNDRGRKMSKDRTNTFETSYKLHYLC